MDYALNMLARLICCITVGWSVEGCKVDNPKAGNKFIPYTQVGHPLGETLGSEVNFLTQFVNSSIQIGYWFDCPKLKFDNETHQEIQNQIRSAIDIWLAPMRSLSKEVISREDIVIKRLAKLDGSPRTERQFIDIGEGYQLGISFSCVGGRSYVASQTTPYIFMSHGNLAALEDDDKYEFCLASDVCYSSFVLLHEFGHVFGLADTYSVGVSLKKGQPLSVMASVIPFTDKDGRLALAPDDIRGAQWLYQHYHVNSELTDCFYDDYELDETGKGCRPKSLIIDMLTNVAIRERHGAGAKIDKLLYTASDAIHYSGKFLENDEIARDRNGNTALHLALIAGADSEKYKNQWLEVITEILQHKNCRKACVVAEDTQGRTFLQLAKELEYDTNSETFQLSNPKFAK